MPVKAMADLLCPGLIQTQQVTTISSHHIILTAIAINNLVMVLSGHDLCLSLAPAAPRSMPDAVEGNQST
jgi:hypothetical protein